MQLILSALALSFVSLATAQQTPGFTIDPTGTPEFTCFPGGGAYCAASNIIIRCNGTAGTPGNCIDNLAGVPGGYYATCNQTSPTSGDAVCCKGSTCSGGGYSPLSALPSNVTTTSTAAANGTTSSVSAQTTTTAITFSFSNTTVTATPTIVAPISTSTGAGVTTGSSGTTVVGATGAATTTASGLVSQISDGQIQGATATATVAPYQGAAGKTVVDVMGLAAVAAGALFML